MKAWVLEDIGKIQLADVKKPEPGSGEALIKVCAAGICGSDVPRVYDTGAHKMPLIIGHEFSGVVEAENADTDWTGKRVGVFPLIPCGRCVPCSQGKHEMCRSYDYIGSRRNGAFAEYVTVPVNNLIEIPDSITFEVAAMLEPMAVAAHAVRRGEKALMDSGIVKDKEQICIGVSGLGPIGLLIVSILMAEGYTNVFCIGRRPLQKEIFTQIADREFARHPGDLISSVGRATGKKSEDLSYDEALTTWVNTHYCDSRNEDAFAFIRARTAFAEGDFGMDLIFECVGSNESINLAVNCAAPGRCVMMVGNPSSDISFDRNIYWKILRNQLTVLGSWNSSFFGENNDWNYVLGLLNDGRLKASELISHRLPAEELGDALLIMKNKSEDYCKIQIHW